MLTAKEIAERLAQDAESVCHHLLPAGTRKGREWLCGSIAGEAGTSLSVCVEGSKRGVWADFVSTDQKGDLLDLWRECRNVTMADAIREAKEWLHITDEPGRAIMQPKQHDKPKSPPPTTGVKLIDKAGPVFAYLTDERKIPIATLLKYAIRQWSGDRNGEHHEAIVFPNFRADGTKPTALKYLSLKRQEDGKKITWSSSDSEWHLFGWPTIPQNARSVIICEGEIDAMTVSTWGYPALSIPAGAGNDGWIDADFDELARFDDIILWFDADGPGEKGLLKAAPRLGLERCRIIRSKHKDPNEALLAGMTKDEFLRLVKAAPSIDPPELQSPEYFREEINEDFFPSDDTAQGSEFFLGPNFPFRIRNGELTIWTGFSGHGKSLALIQSLTHDLSQGERALIASFEIPPRKTLKIMVQQLLGITPGTINDSNPAIDWMTGKLWLINRVGSMKWKELIPIMEYAARRYGVTRFSVDSLLKLGVGGDDYDGQRECVNALVTFAAKFNVHVHLVAHSKKLDDESKPPSKFDVKGTGDMTDLCQNGITIWRNKTKEEKVSDMEIPAMERLKIQNSLHDGSLRMWKQRETGDEPGQKMWLHKGSMQFKCKSEDLVRRYVFPASEPKDPNHPF